MENILKEIKDNGVEIVRFELSDYYAIAHSKSIPARHFKEKATDGLGFFLGHLACDPQAGFALGTRYSEKLGYPDAICFPHLETFRRLPWQEGTARVLIYPTYKDKPVEGYPMHIAQKQLDELEQMGYSLLSAHEYEFFVVDGATRKPITDGTQIRATLRMTKNQKFIRQIYQQLPLVGVDIESIETEYEPGQLEISYKPDFGIKAAHNAFTYRTGIKEIAQQHGMMASFMTKPFRYSMCAGGHFNHSLWDAKRQTPLFYDANETHGISKIGQNWMAGILAHAAALSVFFSPTVNCMLRYQNVGFAPNLITWGIDNRTTALRVKVNGPRGTYVENRLCSAGADPYISLAATVAAGIDGIRNRMELPPPVLVEVNESTIPPKHGRLPSSMEEAIKAIVEDEVIYNAVGEEFMDCFLKLKYRELQLRNDALAGGKDEYKWGREMYFEYM